MGTKRRVIAPDLHPCGLCHEQLPAARFRHHHTSGKRYPNCKSCDAKRAAATRNANRAAAQPEVLPDLAQGEETQRCQKCKRDKPLSAFRVKKSTGKRTAGCMQCLDRQSQLRAEKLGTQPRINGTHQPREQLALATAHAAGALLAGEDPQVLAQQLAGYMMAAGIQAITVDADGNYRVAIRTELMGRVGN